MKDSNSVHRVPSKIVALMVATAFPLTAICLPTSVYASSGTSQSHSTPKQQSSNKDTFGLPASMGLSGVHTVSYDHYSLMVDGKRKFIYSGEFDYWRLPSQSEWLDVLEKMKAAGFNAVTIYFNWAYHSPKPGVYNFKGIRNVNKLLTMAQRVGLYVIARPGPYINGETDAGGLPDWTLTEKGKARSSAPDYTAAYMQWLSHIDPIIARHQITRGGSVILYQIENEYTGGDATYMQQIENKVRVDGINVPLFSNDKGGPQGRWATGMGAVNMYGFDRYPGYNIPMNFDTPHQFVPNEPIFLPELGGGWFDPWGGTGYAAVRQKYGPNYESTVYQGVAGQGATLMSIYMTYGGTNWGWLPFPGVYTSYDYGAAIKESRQLGPKYSEQKLVAHMFQSVKPLSMTDSLNAVSPSNTNLLAEARVNPDTHTQFYVLRHRDGNSSSNDTTHLAINTADGKYTIPQQPGTSIDINGRESKMLLADYQFGDQHLVYSTSELMTSAAIGKRDVAVFYGDKGTDGETVLRYSKKPKVTVLSGGKVTTTWNSSNGNLRLDYQHTGVTRVLIQGGKRNLLLLLGTTKDADSFWSQNTSGGPVLESGPYLVRTAQIKNGILALQGDTSSTTPLTVYAPSSVKRITWNGRPVDMTQDSAGAWVGTLAGPKSVTIPALTNWKFQYGTPEAQLSFNDSKWTNANHMTTNNPTKPKTLPVLYMDDYGFHHGMVWYRGHFNATGKETSITLDGQGGQNGAYSVWLNGAFLGTSSGTNTFTFPKALLNKGKDNVVAVMLESMGHNEDGGSNDAQKQPRGLLEAKINGSRDAISWKIQGNKGGENLVDPVRGPFNSGGLYGENYGWNMPGYPDGSWQKVSLPDSWSKRGVPAGVGWYRTSFNLNLPKQSDVPIGLKISDGNTTRAYRALIYVNGWMMGQYINNIGPQHVFSLPPGVLNPHGHNEIAIAVWGQNETAGGLGKVSLDELGNYVGGVPVKVDNSPGYSAQKYGVPNAPNNVTVSLSSQLKMLEPGQTTKVTGVVLDNSQNPVHNVTVNLKTPSGWIVKKLSSTNIGLMKGNSPTTVKWSVTAPQSMSNAASMLDANVTYKNEGNLNSTNAVIHLGAPPQAKPIAELYNNKGISNNSDSSAANFDVAGDSYSAQALAKLGYTPGTEITYDGVKFSWPNVKPGVADNIVANGQTIRVSGSGTKLAFLGASNRGTTSGTGVIYYTDGSTQQFHLNFGDFWYGPSSSDQTAVTTPYVNNASSGRLDHPVHIYYTSVPIEAAKTVMAVKLPSISSPTSGRTTPKMHIFSIAIK